MPNVAKAIVTLVPLPGNNPGDVGERTFHLETDGDVLYIGRASSNASKKLIAGSDNGWIESPVMSRDHATLWLSELESEKLYIRDLGSMHGTFVNQQRVTSCEPQTLCTGDVVTFGSQVISANTEYLPQSYTVQCRWESTTGLPEFTDESDCEGSVDGNEAEKHNSPTPSRAAPVSKRTTSVMSGNEDHRAIPISSLLAQSVDDGSRRSGNPVYHTEFDTYDTSSSSCHPCDEPADQPAANLAVLLMEDDDDPRGPPALQCGGNDINQSFTHHLSHHATTAACFEACEKESPQEHLNGTTHGAFYASSESDPEDFKEAVSSGLVALTPSAAKTLPKKAIFSTSTAVRASSAESSSVAFSIADDEVIVVPETLIGTDSASGRDSAEMASLFLESDCDALEREGAPLGDKDDILPQDWSTPSSTDFKGDFSGSEHEFEETIDSPNKADDSIDRGSPYSTISPQRDGGLSDGSTASMHDSLHGRSASPEAQDSRPPRNASITPPTGAIPLDMITYLDETDDSQAAECQYIPQGSSRHSDHSHETSLLGLASKQPCRRRNLSGVPSSNCDYAPRSAASFEMLNKPESILGLSASRHRTSQISIRPTAAKAVPSLWDLAHRSRIGEYGNLPRSRWPHAPYLVDSPDLWSEAYQSGSAERKSSRRGAPIWTLRSFRTKSTGTKRKAESEHPYLDEATSTEAMQNCRSSPMEELVDLPDAQPRESIASSTPSSLEMLQEPSNHSLARDAESALPRASKRARTSERQQACSGHIKDVSKIIGGAVVAGFGVFLALAATCPDPIS